MKTLFKNFSIVFTLTIIFFIIFDLIIGKIYKNEINNFDRGAYSGISTFFARIIGEQPPCDPNIYSFLANDMGCIGKNINNAEIEDNIVVIGGSTVFGGFPPFHEVLDKNLKANGLYPIFVDGLHTQQFAKNILAYEIFNYLNEKNIF